MKKETEEAIDQLNLIIAELKGDRLSTSELRELLDHKSIVVRVNALEALSRQARQNAEVITDIVRAALDPSNNTRLLGARVSHVAVACLLKVGTEQAQAEASRLIDEWSEPDRTDLLWFLRSESLCIGSA